jgi:hypothetical protein
VQEQTFPCLTRLVGSGNIRRSLVYSSEWENSCLGTATGLSARRLPGKYIGDLSLRADNVAASWPVFLQRFFGRGSYHSWPPNWSGHGLSGSSEEQHPATLQSFARFDKASSRLLVSASMRWKGTLSSLVLACTHVPAQYLNPARQDSGFTFTAEDLAGNSPSE